ncbi:MAG: proline--tRNA ligase [Candidatus Dependentiae bacterium]|nr:proline--tRNA ligase [Candidatus Dependentiae bacterium]
MSSKLPDINTHFSDWYNDVIYQAELADLSPVRGCIVIRPYGFAMWEQVRDRLDKRIKETGHHNASFPLFIPESFLKREAKHVEGFAPEVAVVTHAGGKLLDEPLIVRPTSETMIHFMFAKWMKSWRDLPLKINQWCNVVRWEMRTRPFLRTTEFFWQEGHTAHETLAEAEAEVAMMLREYVDLAENYLAIPVVAGPKPESEKFPGAEKTYTFEGFMPDGKALQMGTSHLLSQSFAVSFEMTFQDREGKLAYPYLTSWGATTRLIGAIVMAHGDQKGLILPPKIAPIQVVIIPIFRNDADKQIVLDAVNKIVMQLKEQNIRVHVDAEEQKTPGAKFYTWELKGVPVRMEIGPRDIASNQAILADRLGMGKKSVSLDTIAQDAAQLLDEVQKQLFQRAFDRRAALWHKEATFAAISKKLSEQNGFYQTGWCRDEACEAPLKTVQASIRCLLQESTFAICFNCDKASLGDILIAKSY